MGIRFLFLIGYRCKWVFGLLRFYIVIVISVWIGFLYWRVI